MATKPSNELKQSSAPFEAYTYYAFVTRTAEDEAEKRFSHSIKPTFLQQWFATRPATQVELEARQAADHSMLTSEVKQSVSHQLDSASQGINSSEVDSANRGARVATWGSVAYLIVTDIFGPSSAP